MNEIEFSKGEKEILIQKIQNYFNEELDKELGQFEAQFLLDFFATEMGTFFYNRGIYDAQALLNQKIEDITESMLDLKKITEFRK